MPTEIRFYHLERATLDQALPLILTKAYEKGHRIVLRVPDQSEASRVNAMLWSWNEQSFLPHGTAEEGAAEDQPIWITDQEENPNHADVLVLTGGIEAGSIEDYALCCDVFDGAKEDQLQAARGR